MKKIFSIVLSLALLVSLGALTTAPVMATTAPSISPTSATFDLSNPSQVATTISWGSAISVTGITGYSEAGSTNLGASGGGNYTVFDTLLVITSSYLSGVLTDIGKSVILVITFDVGVCTLTITATGTNPSINPTSKTWVLASGASVNTTILWGCIGNNITGIKDDDGDTVAWSTGYTLGATNATTNQALLTITSSYLTPELLTVGATTKLTIDFAMGNNVTFTITAAAAPVPGVSPSTVPYDLQTRANVSTTITWANATAIVSIYDITTGTSPVPMLSNLISPFAFDYAIAADNATLIIAGNKTGTPYWGGLQCRLDAGARSARLLRITFNDAASSQVILTVTPSDFTVPSITPVAIVYDLDAARLDPLFLTVQYAAGVVSLGTAAGIDCVTDITQNADGSLKYPPKGLNLTTPTQFTLSYSPVYGGWLLLILRSTYVASAAAANLTRIGDKATLLVQWSPTGPYFTVGACPVSTAAYPYMYLPIKVTITATGVGASIAPKTADFNLDAPAPADVTTTITWGYWAKNVTAVKNGLNSLALNTDYTVSPATGNATTPSTLTINASYLSTVLTAVDDVAALDVVFDQGDNAKLTITAIGTPLCFIATAAGANAPQLDTLRAFRDNVLRGNVLGDAFIRAYYTVSPSIAKVIAGNEVLKKLVMDFVVEPAVSIAQWVMGK